MTFGLGQLDHADELDHHLALGQGRRRLKNLKADRVYRISEDAGRAP